jgi:hypothetical protein
MVNLFRGETKIILDNGPIGPHGFGYSASGVVPATRLSVGVTPFPKPGREHNLAGLLLLPIERNRERKAGVALAAFPATIRSVKVLFVGWQLRDCQHLARHFWRLTKRKQKHIKVSRGATPAGE